MKYDYQMIADFCRHVRLLAQHRLAEAEYPSTLDRVPEYAALKKKYDEEPQLVPLDVARATELLSLVEKIAGSTDEFYCSLHDPDALMQWMIRHDPFLHPQFRGLAQHHGRRNPRLRRRAGKFYIENGPSAPAR